MASPGRVPLGIFWDIENCSIPAEVPPEGVAANIRTALQLHTATRGNFINVFSAYGDFNQFPRKLREGCQQTGVSLLDVPNGKKDAADKAILSDLFLFALDNPPPCCILLISGDIDFAPSLHKLGQRGFGVLLAVPVQVGVAAALCSAGRFVWDWPSLARGEGLVPSKAVLGRRQAYCAPQTGGAMRENSEWFAPHFQSEADCLQHPGTTVASPLMPCGHRAEAADRSRGCRSAPGPIIDPPEAQQSAHLPGCQPAPCPQACGYSDFEHGSSDDSRAGASRQPPELCRPPFGPSENFSCQGSLEGGGKTASLGASRASLVPPGLVPSHLLGREPPRKSAPSGKQAVEGGEGNFPQGCGNLTGWSSSQRRCMPAVPTSNGYKGLESPFVAPGDLQSLKILLMMLLKCHGGRLELSKVPSEYRRLSGRPLFLADYGVSRLAQLIAHMGDCFTIFGHGVGKVLCLKACSSATRAAAYAKTSMKNRAGRELPEAVQVSTPDKTLSASKGPNFGRGGIPLYEVPVASRKRGLDGSNGGNSLNDAKWMETGGKPSFPVATAWSCACEVETAGLHAGECSEGCPDMAKQGSGPRGHTVSALAEFSESDAFSLVVGDSPMDKGRGLDNNEEEDGEPEEEAKRIRQAEVAVEGEDKDDEEEKVVLFDQPQLDVQRFRSPPKDVHRDELAALEKGGAASNKLAGICYKPAPSQAEADLSSPDDHAARSKCSDVAAAGTAASQEELLPLDADRDEINPPEVLGLSSGQAAEGLMAAKPTEVAGLEEEGGRMEYSNRQGEPLTVLQMQSEQLGQMENLSIGFKDGQDGDRRSRSDDMRRVMDAHFEGTQKVGGMRFFFPPEGDVVDSSSSASCSSASPKRMSSPPSSSGLSLDEVEGAYLQMQPEATSSSLPPNLPAGSVAHDLLSVVTGGSMALPSSSATPRLGAGFPLAAAKHPGPQQTGLPHGKQMLKLEQGLGGAAALRGASDLWPASFEQQLAAVCQLYNTPWQLPPGPSAPAVQNPHGDKPGSDLRRLPRPQKPQGPPLAQQLDGKLAGNRESAAGQTAVTLAELSILREALRWNADVGCLRSPAGSMCAGANKQGTHRAAGIRRDLQELLVSHGGHLPLRQLATAYWLRHGREIDWESVGSLEDAKHILEVAGRLVYKQIGSRMEVFLVAEDAPNQEPRFRN